MGTSSISSTGISSSISCTSFTWTSSISSTSFTSSISSTSSILLSTNTYTIFVKQDSAPQTYAFTQRETIVILIVFSTHIQSGYWLLICISLFFFTEESSSIHGCGKLQKIVKLIISF